MEDCGEMGTLAYEGWNCLSSVNAPVIIGQPLIGYPYLTLDMDSNAGS